MATRLTWWVGDLSVGTFERLLIDNGWIIDGRSFVWDTPVKKRRNKMHSEYHRRRR